MLRKPILFLVALIVTVTKSDSVTKNKDKPYVVLPVPLEFPNRNDRAEQCYLRIEDIEIVETISMYCTIAHEFLKEHITEYNFLKQTEDGVEVSPWNDDKPSAVSSTTKPVYVDYTNMKHWKISTILDPIIKMRIYVSKKADCRLIMNNLDGTSNYNVNCEKILSYVNESSNSANSISCLFTSFSLFIFCVLSLLTL